MKLIRDHAHAKNIEAYIILDKQGNEAFTVHTRQIGPSNYQVDVWDTKSLILQTKGNSVNNALHSHMIGGVTLFEEGTPHKDSARMFNHWIDLKSLGNEYRKQARYYEARIRKKHGARISMIAVYYIAGIKRMESFGYKVIKVL